MARLIDVTDLINKCKSLSDEHETTSISYNALYEVLLQQPIACDVDIERMTPMAIKIEGEGNMAECLCPNCDTYLGVACGWKYDQTKYCHECGQALVKFEG